VAGFPTTSTVFALGAKKASSTSPFGSSLNPLRGSRIEFFGSRGFGMALNGAYLSTWE